MEKCVVVCPVNVTRACIELNYYVLFVYLRNLGDLAFLFHQYETAYQAYHAAKRDFHGDQAWLYCAGAEEMAALSVFMLGKDGPRSYPHHYFKNAINAYLNVCKYD